MFASVTLKHNGPVLLREKLIVMVKIRMYLANILDNITIAIKHGCIE